VADPSHNNHLQKMKFLVDESSHGMRLDKFLAANVPGLSRSRLQNLVETGMVELSGRNILKPGKKLSTGEKITLSIPRPEPLDLSPEDIPLDILFEDRHLIVINKPPGMVVHPGAGNTSGTLVHALLARCQDLSGIGGKLRPGIVHRLDKDTSGIMVAAKTDQAHTVLTEMFKKRLLKKKYTALIQGQMPDSSGVISLPIGRHPQRRTRMSVNFRNGRESVTGYKVVKNLGSHQMLDLRLHTGRTHQIRVHLSHLGHPLLGDKAYGGPAIIRAANGEQLVIGRQMLHSGHLEFIHPVSNETVSLHAPLPDDMAAVIGFLSGSS